MSRPKLALVLVALLCGSGSAFLFASAVPLFDQIIAVLATGLANAVFAALAIAVSAMTVLAASLVVTDLRSDLDAAQAWQSINSQLILSDRPSGAGTADIDWPYATLPQDVRVRHIFLAQRLAMRTLDCGDANSPDGSAAEHDRPAVTDGGSTSMAWQVINDATPLDAISFSSTPRLIAENTKLQHFRTTGNGQRRTTVRGAKERLVANAGRWQLWGLHQPRPAAPSGNTADVIVLGARIEQCDSPAVLQTGFKSVEPPETSCRGPPAPRTQPLYPKADHVGPHHNLAVFDNFGQTVPVNIAELNVIETFLGDVLDDVLAASGAAKDRQTA